MIGPLLFAQILPLASPRRPFRALAISRGGAAFREPYGRAGDDARPSNRVAIGLFREHRQQDNPHVEQQ
jgi:hypothetical protein